MRIVYRLFLLLVLAALIAGCGQPRTTLIPATATSLAVTATLRILPSGQAPSATATEASVPITTTALPATEAGTPEAEPSYYSMPRLPESGEAFRFEDVARTTYSGVTYRLTHLLIARREVLLPEYYAYSPLLAGKQTILYARLEVTNAGGTAVIAPPVGVLALLDERGRALDAFRLADYLAAGTTLPHTGDHRLEPGERYTFGYWLGTEAAPDEILGLSLALNCPVPQGSQNCLGNVILSADLRGGQALEQVFDISQVKASSGSEPVEIDGMAFELTRLFIAPSEAVPEIAGLLPADTQSEAFVGTVVQFIYRITNRTGEPRTVRYLENALFAWDIRPPEQPEQILLTEF